MTITASPAKPQKTKLAIDTRCTPGDLWQLGEHRLLCGDAMKSEDVARLMQGERFALAVTSPPYDQQRTYNLADFDWHACYDVRRL